MDSSRFRCDIIAASADSHQRNQEETEMDATTVAVDLAKTVFELAIANAEWRIIAHQRLNRAQFTRFSDPDGTDARRDGGLWYGAPLGSGRAGTRPPCDAPAARVRAPVRPSQ